MNFSTRPDRAPIIELPGLLQKGDPLPGQKNILWRALATLKHAYALLVFETPARWSGMDRLIKRLEDSGQSLEKHLAKVSGRAANREILVHMLRIERSGQRRLCVALGEPLCEDLDDTRPLAQNWPLLVEAYKRARKETISLCKSIRMARIDPKTRIPHQQYGDISLLGWLYYLHLYAAVESMRIY